MRKLSLCLMVMLLAALALSACHKSEPEQATQATLAADGSTPELAVTSAIDQLKAGNFDSLMHHALPPDAYKEMRAQWEAERKRDLARVTDADRQRFDQQMKELTQADAKTQLMAKIQPVLDQYQSKYKQRIPMTVGIIRIMAETRITQSKTLTAEQKSQARGVVEAVVQWIQDTHWDDKAKAEQAVDIVVDTARDLKMKTLDDAFKLNYEQAMQRYGTAWKGVKKLLDVYGLSLDDTLDSAKVKTLFTKGDKATVEVDYQVLGKPMSSTVEMVREGKRWYAADALKKWHEEQAKMTAAASTAGAASTAVPATSGAR